MIVNTGAIPHQSQCEQDTGQLWLESSSPSSFSLLPPLSLYYPHHCHHLEHDLFHHHHHHYPHHHQRCHQSLCHEDVHHSDRSLTELVAPSCFSTMILMTLIIGVLVALMLNMWKIIFMMTNVDDNGDKIVNNSSVAMSSVQNTYF